MNTISISTMKPAAPQNGKAIIPTIEQEKIKLGLSKEKAQELFEAQFGKDQSRTRKQWKNLVKTYGYDVVCAKEGMAKKEVKAKCKNG